MPSLPQSLTVQPAVLWVPNESPELRDRDGEWNEASVIQEETGSDLLHHLHMQVYGAGWDPPKGSTEGAGGTAHWATCHHLPNKQGGPR